MTAPRQRLSALVALVILATAALSLLSLWSPYRLAEARVFDLLSTASLPDMAELERTDGVVIVAIDEPSFADLGLQWPWPRSLHAQLVDALRKAGAKVIGLDLVFAEPSDPDADAALADALGPDVVLAADQSLIETPQMSQMSRTEPFPELLGKGPGIGLASMSLDADAVLRRVPMWPDSLAGEMLARLGVPEAMRNAALGRYLQAMGPPRTYPTVSYYQALDPEMFLPPGFFQGKVVLVGRSLQMAVTADSGQADSFPSSYTVRNRQLVPGVEMHATMLDNIRHGLTFGWATLAQTVAYILLAAAVAGAIGWRPADAWMLAGGIALVAAVGGVSAIVLGSAKLFLPPLAPALAVAMVLAPVAIHDVAYERRRRRAITRAFTHYLSPAQVARLARDPDALKLGGEKRNLTILFSDVRNFTPLCESMKDEPERLTRLMNRLLTPLSEAVMDNGGTIDKFIGDCIMAFWNAPLDDPDHAMHAVEAALAMLTALEKLNGELAAEAAAEGRETLPLAVGVGINTGTCIVGNMGSERRFDYSVLGDAVNYAARLESASKPCGVPLLLGAATADAVRDHMSPVLVDRISVKGRSGTAPVYTVLSRKPLPAAAVEAFEATVERLLDGHMDEGPAPEHSGLAELQRRIAERELNSA